MNFKFYYFKILCLSCNKRQNTRNILFLFQIFFCDLLCNIIVVGFVYFISFVFDCDAMKVLFKITGVKFPLNLKLWNYEESKLMHVISLYTKIEEEFNCFWTIEFVYITDFDIEPYIIENSMFIYIKWRPVCLTYHGWD